MRRFLALALLLAPAPVLAQDAAAVVAPILAEAGPGTRWGMVATDAQGREIIAINPENRFIPASNTKIYTTAAALWRQTADAGQQTDEHGTRVYIAGTDAVLEGRGDPGMSAAPGCVADCLATLADAVAVRTRRIRDVIGDATLFPDQRWSPGMSWNNIPSSSGTAIAALSVDDNEIAALVAPAAAIGAPPVVTLPGYYTVDNRAVTVAGDGDTLAYDRAPNGRVLVISGTIGAARAPVTWRLGVDDPADYAAWRFAAMLKERGVRVTGAARSRYRPLLPQDDPALRGDTRPLPLPFPVPGAEAGAGAGAAPAPSPTRTPAPNPLAVLAPVPLADDVVTINKQSQNLHAELLLRRLGLANGTGSLADGQAVVAAMLAEAGVPPAQASLLDGSGMSTYNRVTPRGTVRLLQWSQRQPWGAALRASLPVGGVDGTLRRRFADTPLAGRIFAKTGTLNATNALAGWLVAASGQVLTFAVYANDVPEDVRATAIMDRALLALAAAN